MTAVSKTTMFIYHHILTSFPSEESKFIYSFRAGLSAAAKFWLFKKLKKVLQFNFELVLKPFRWLRMLKNYWTSITENKSDLSYNEVVTEITTNNELMLPILIAINIFGTFGNILSIWVLWLWEETRNKKSSPSIICLKFFSKWNLFQCLCFPLMVAMYNCFDPNTAQTVRQISFGIGKVTAL